MVHVGPKGVPYAMRLLEGKIAVVTGGASGIGRASALRCAAEGARVVIADVQDVELTIDAARARHLDMVFRRTDVSIPNEVAGLMRWTVAHCGGLDILIAAAG